MSEGVEDRVRKVEFAIWGLQGTNGLVGDVKAIRRMIEAQDAEREKREAEERRERKQDRRWWIGTVFVVIMAILGAAQIVASSLG